MEADYKTLCQEIEALGGVVEKATDKTVEGYRALNKKVKKQISDIRQAQVIAQATQTDDEVKDINGIQFVGKVLPDVPAKDLKGMADEFKKKIGSGVVVLIATDNEGAKASIVVAVTSDLIEKVNAVDLVRVGSEALGGKGGGGRPDMAQAGGPNPDAANDAVLKIEEKLA